MHRARLTRSEVRRARTRSLIQLGGLVEKSGVLVPLNLTLGDDMQQDENCFEGTATLLGALCDMRLTLHGDGTQTMLWREKGKAVLRS